MCMIDLHLHTTASDGSLTPTEVVFEAKARGVQLIAVTDHDTVDGVEEALAAARGVGVTVVPAVEINADFRDEEVHVLGYYIDPTLNWLRDYFAEAQKQRTERIWKIAANIRRLYGVPIDFAELEQMVGEAVVTRGHLNRYLVELGVASSMADAEKRFTGNHCPSYVPRATATTQEAIAMIKQAGGIAVIAHPGRIRKQEVIEHVIKAGVDGIEAYYYLHTQSQTAEYAQLARERGLLVTGGSDCHGPKFNSGGVIRIGTVPVPTEVEALLRRPA